MKVAIPTKNSRVDQHFGHCDTFAIYDVDENLQIISKEELKWAGQCGCKSDLVGQLKGLGVQTILVGNLGHGALNVLSNHGLKVIRGCHGKTDDVLSEFLNGRLVDEDVFCNHHQSCH